jgi:hypothetical protein
MLTDDIELVSSNDFYNGHADGDMGEAWERIKKFCEEALKLSHNSDYAAALKTYREYTSSGVSTIEHFVTFPSWCEERLNSSTEKLKQREAMNQPVEIDCSSLKTQMTDTIKAVEFDMSQSSRKTLVDFNSLVGFVLADLKKGKTARFIEAHESGYVGLCWWPSLTFCSHEGALYQLWSTTALVGYDQNADPNEDRQKVWVRVKGL